MMGRMRKDGRTEGQTVPEVAVMDRLDDDDDDEVGAASVAPSLLSTIC